MNLLWKKETSGAIYIDIFENVEECVIEYPDRNKSIVDKTGLFKTVSHGRKSNEVATQFRKAGNHFFKEKNFLSALRFYNFCLCMAENGSLDVSMAYVNRATCFLNMKFYEKCLTDIDLAIQANYPPELMPELKSLRADC